ncbi:MAG: radical SAM/SPASM domain-containing protein [Planctomycetota bacterium]
MSTLQQRKAENSRLLRQELAQGALTHTARPEVLVLNHSDLCNLRCVMCPRHLAQGTHRLAAAVLERLCDRLLPTARKLTLTTAGGEPLLADFDLLLAKALEYEARLDVVTNGVLLTPELYRRGRGTFDHVNVSVDSHVPAVYEHIRQPASFARVHANLVAIRDERRTRPDDVLWSLSAVVMRANVGHLAEFVEFAGGVGADGVILQPLSHAVKPTPEQDPSTQPGSAVVARELARAGDAARAHGVNLLLGELGLPSVIVRPFRDKVPPPMLGHGICQMAAQNFSVMYTGEVYPCCIPTDYRLGNVLFEDPFAIWNGKPWQSLRRLHHQRTGSVFCSGCVHAPHLPARRHPALDRRLARARVLTNHALGPLKRWLDGRAGVARGD